MVGHCPSGFPKRLFFVQKPQIMNLKLPYFNVFLALTVCLFSRAGFAQQYNYAPNSIHYAHLKNKYDSSIGLGLSKSFNMRAIEIQAAFSPVEHGAVMVNYLGAGRDDVKNQLSKGSSSHFLEFGMGAYEATGRGIASLIVGYGQGSIFNKYENQHRASFHLRRWFIQPSLLFQGRNFECGLALRFNRLVYAGAKVDYAIDQNNLNKIKAIDAKSPFFLPEFGVHMAVVIHAVSVGLNFTSLFFDADSYNFIHLNTDLMLTVNLESFYQHSMKPKVQ